MQIRRYRVTNTQGKTFIVKAEEHYNGLFAQRTEWELYWKPENSGWGGFSYLSKTNNPNRIGEIIRLNIPGDIKNIEAI